MKSLLALIRILIIVGLVALALEYFFSTETTSAILEYREIGIFLLFLTIVLIAAEMVLYRVGKITNELLTDEQKARKEQTESTGWFAEFYKKLIDQKPIEKEADIILDHNYDGIQELDNNLPPWWVYLFVACIIFAGVYLVNYHMLGGSNQAKEYDNEQEYFAKAIEAYKKANPNLVSADNVVLLKDAGDLQAGKDIYQANCIACHAPDGGGGIGPNLTDTHWILGGGIKNVFSTITNGGRSGQGMAPWKGALTPKQIQQVSSYVISLGGTTPMNPKPPQGDVWTE